MDADYLYFIYCAIAGIILFVTLFIINTVAGAHYSRELTEKWHNDPANWKQGVFYYNPEDKRIFPPKRMRAAGWTINFANPLSIIAFLILLAIVIALFSFLGTGD